MMVHVGWLDDSERINTFQGPKHDCGFPRSIQCHWFGLSWPPKVSTRFHIVLAVPDRPNACASRLVARWWTYNGLSAANPFLSFIFRDIADDPRSL